mgnify:CR=1 FL=1
MLVLVGLSGAGAAVGALSRYGIMRLALPLNRSNRRFIARLDFNQLITAQLADFSRNWDYGWLYDFFNNDQRTRVARP